MRCRMNSRIAAVMACIIALVPGEILADQADHIITGQAITFAGTVPMTAYLRWVSGPPGVVRVDAWEIRDGRAIQSYDVDMTKLMHMIVVSDDLTDFQHVHPTLLSNGHFTIELHLAHPEQATISIWMGCRAVPVVRFSALT
jgi:hypothetical protein